MKIKRDRNYYLSFICCITCSILALLGDSYNIKFLILSDINVGLWLFVAWLFDDK